MQGAMLRAWREEHDPPLSQRAAAERLAQHNDAGRAATQAAWASWESGKKAPDLFFAFAIDRMTHGRISAQGWAVARRIADADSGTLPAVDSDHRDAG